MMPPFSAFEKTLRERFGGKLGRLSHKENLGEACVIECANASIGNPWSDFPGKWPDVRVLNDAAWTSEDERALHMSRLMRAYWDWSEWADERLSIVVDTIITLTVRQLIADIPGLSPTVVQDCRSVTNLYEAERAAKVAYRALNLSDGFFLLGDPLYALEAAKSALSGNPLQAAREIARVGVRSRHISLPRIVDLWVEAAEGTK